jgi:hypothetical protein
MINTPTIERAYVDAHGPDDEALRFGFAWLVRRAVVGDGWAALFVPSLQQIEPLAAAVGGRGVAALKKSRRLKVNGADIELFTDRTLRVTYRQGPVLGVWVDDNQLDKLENLGAPALCAIPWNRADIDAWKRAWNPTDLRTGDKPHATEATIANPVVLAALESLTTRVNLSTGLGHPSDKAAAVQLFLALRNGGERFDPGQVHAWAASHGWRAAHARQLGELAQKITDGKTVKAGQQQAWRPDILTIWRADAQRP